VPDPIDRAQEIANPDGVQTAPFPGREHPGEQLQVQGPKGSPRGSGESVEMTVDVTSAPAGTLDAAASVVVNGPRDFPEDWDQVNWARVEDEVRRLRQRIFTASRAGEHRKVRNLHAPYTLRRPQGLA
jgi:hypothetical protein